MIRTALAAALLALPTAAAAQSSAAPGAGPADSPRAVGMFAGARGYADVGQADRFGTVMDPARDEGGLYLLIRAFRNVCLGLERGDPLETALPPSYAAYGQNAYYFGRDGADPSGRLVLSPTGDIDADEADGHPTFWLEPAAAGMTCRLEWTFEPGLPADRQLGMAHLLETWLPFALALVPAAPPERAAGQPLFGFAEWDRYCGGRWCPMTVNFRLGTASVTLDTTLNITGIEGAAP